MNSSEKNLLHCPKNRLGGTAKDSLEKAGIEFTTVFTEEIEPALFVPDSAYPYKGIKQIQEFINSQNTPAKV